MNYKIGVLALVALQALAVSAQRPCVCARNFRPVCGSDGVTYSNECRLRCEQSKGNSVTKVLDGPCKSSDAVQVAVPCTCPENLNEVCGSDGKTYANDCLLNCATASDNTLSISHQGKCLTVKVANFPTLPACTCPSTESPVCGTNGQTYNNDCLLNCATANDPSLGISHAGACGQVNVVNGPSKPLGGCTCTRNLAPVCGSDGVTYNNICLLQCAGQDVARYGSC